ncbi:hypothetical protein B0H14DRAFT_3867913 [Mycena olivaceomarginata]|nr:hypothetical protein B0H14DRAFT_3867913 [Mycena olivaceomarginata]
MSSGRPRYKHPMTSPGHIFKSTLELAIRKTELAIYVAQDRAVELAMLLTAWFKHTLRHAGYHSLQTAARPCEDAQTHEDDPVAVVAPDSNPIELEPTTVHSSKANPSLQTGSGEDAQVQNMREDGLIVVVAASDSALQPSKMSLSSPMRVQTALVADMCFCACNTDVAAHIAPPRHLLEAASPQREVTLNVIPKIAIPDAPVSRPLAKVSRQRLSTSNSLYVSELSVVDVFVCLGLVLFLLVKIVRRAATVLTIHTVHDDLKLRRPSLLQLDRAVLLPLQNSTTVDEREQQHAPCTQEVTSLLSPALLSPTPPLTTDNYPESLENPSAPAAESTPASPLPVFASPEIASTSTPMLLPSPFSSPPPPSSRVPCTVQVARRLLELGFADVATGAELRVLYKWAGFATPAYLLPLEPVSAAGEWHHSKGEGDGRDIGAHSTVEEHVRGAIQQQAHITEVVGLNASDADSDGAPSFHSRGKTQVWRGRRWGA